VITGAWMCTEAAAVQLRDKEHDHCWHIAAATLLMGPDEPGAGRTYSYGLLSAARPPLQHTAAIRHSFVGGMHAPWVLCVHGSLVV
jgi:hypothetical protein